MAAHKPSPQAQALEAAFHRLHGTDRAAPLLIGLAGRKGAGKATAAEWLCFHADFERIALADPIKDGLAAMLGIDACAFSEPALKETVIDWLGCTPRHLMQTLGTEWGQRHVARDLWTRIAQHKIDTHRRRSDLPIVVTDIRFEHEADWIRKQGGHIWHIRRDSQSHDAHASELGITGTQADVWIDNTGSLQRLHAQLSNALRCSQ